MAFSLHFTIILSHLYHILRSLLQRKKTIIFQNLIPQWDFEKFSLWPEGTKGGNETKRNWSISHFDKGQWTVLQLIHRRHARQEKKKQTHIHIKRVWNKSLITFKTNKQTNKNLSQQKNICLIRNSIWKTVSSG